jgi:SAM-dependent methyltransferase
MRDYHFTPESYLTMMREAVPGYDRLQDETFAATGVGAKSILELGTGTGETVRRVLDRHRDAQLIGIDASPGMVKVARDSLPSDRVRVIVGRLEDPCRRAFRPRRIGSCSPSPRRHRQGRSLPTHRQHARPGRPFRPRRRRGAGRSLVCRDGNRPEVDHPSKLDEQLAWLEAACLFPEVTWTHRDLVVIVASPD